jgi:hypothetical protein
MIDKIEALELSVENVSQTNNLNPLAGVVDGIFIPHYSKSDSRKRHMLDLFKDYNLKLNFVTGMDREQLESFSSPFMQCIVASTDNPFIIREVWGFPPKLGEISLTIKNFYIYYWILSSGSNSALILEDDSEFQIDSTLEDAAKVIKLTPPNYSIIQLGTCIYTKNQINPGYRNITSSLGVNGQCNFCLIMQALV